MANRLVLKFLFVILAGGFMGTYAQSNTANATTAASTVGTTATTATAGTTATTVTAGTTATTVTAGTTATTVTAGTTATTVTAGTTATTATVGTSATTATVGTTATTASAAPTTASGTATTASTAPTTASGAPTTASGAPTTASAAPTTASAAPTTASAAPTTASVTSTATTTAAPFIPNSAVTNLTAPISASNCSKTQLCTRQPSGCDPTTGTGCFFLAVQQLSGQNFEFSLSGNSSGYIAAILSTTPTVGSNATTYICANNNGFVQYFSALFNSGTLTNTTLPVTNVRGSVNGSKIQCIFDVTVPNSNQRAGTSFSESIATGSFNASTGALGNPTFQITTSPVDLTNVTATITNLLTANTTAAPTVATTNNAITIQQSLMQALLITVGVLSLTML